MQITCTQCGAEVSVRQGELFLFCSSCNSSLFIDRSKVVFNYRLKPTLSQELARASLLRWMAGNSTIRDLDSKATIDECRFIYHPFWYLRLQSDSEENRRIKLAHPSTISELSEMSIPAGDLLFLTPLDFDPEQFLSPSVSLPTAMQGLEPGSVREASLVFVPIFRFLYSYNGVSYSALVDGSSGRVFANLYPKKNEVPFVSMGALCLGTFFLLGLFTGDDTASKLLLYAVATPVLTAVAYQVARKV